MGQVPDRVRLMSHKQIFELGRKGVSEEVIFDSLELNIDQRKRLRSMAKWYMPYKKGQAQREIDLAEYVRDAKDNQLIKEMLKGTSITQVKAIDDSIEFIIDAPEWMKPKLNKGKKGQRAKAND